MAKKQGKCSNIDGCSLYDEIQEVDELDDFVCKECGHELEELKPRKKKSNPLPLIIGGAVVVVGIVVGLIFAFSGNDDEEIIEPNVTEEVEVKDSTTVVENAVPNRNDTLVIIKENAQTPEVAAEEVAEGKAIEGTAAMAPASSAAPAARPAASQSVAPAATSHKLSYGSWTGGWKNGQPHGTGTMTYSTSHTIDSRDSKGRVAQPGEYIVGEWDNGHLVQGRWFKKDGTKEAVIIGKAG